MQASRLYRFGLYRMGYTKLNIEVGYTAGLTGMGVAARLGVMLAQLRFRLRSHPLLAATACRPRSPYQPERP
jgi:hypothetical protein